MPGKNPTRHRQTAAPPADRPMWLDEAFIFGTARRSRKGRNLARDARVVVHLESGDQAVILEGRVQEITDAGLVRDHVAAYHQKYRFRPDPDDRAQVTYGIRPRKAFGWHERDCPESATRWCFPRRLARIPSARRDASA